MSPSVLLVDKQDGIAALTLNRPEQMNALSMERRTAIRQRGRVQRRAQAGES